MMEKTEECKPERMAWERLFARGFVIAGGLFWIVAAFAAWYGLVGESFVQSVGGALYPFLITVAAFVIGWRYELLASILLAIGAVGISVWGIVSGWTAGLWIVMAIALITPMVVAAVLFYLASRMERVCEITAGDQTTVVGHAA